MEISNKPKYWQSLLLFCLLGWVLGSVLTACTKNPVSHEKNQTEEMTAYVNGELWSSDAGMVLVHTNVPKPFLSFQGYAEVNGKMQSQMVLMTDNRSFSLPETITYPYLGQDSVEYLAMYQVPAKGDSGMYFSIAGEMTVTLFEGIGGRATGTFWFTAVNIYGDTLKVERGTFDLPVRQSPTR
jgi:hypothetical protein